MKPVLFFDANFLRNFKSVGFEASWKQYAKHSLDLNCIGEAELYISPYLVLEYTGYEKLKELPKLPKSCNAEEDPKQWVEKAVDAASEHTNDESLTKAYAFAMNTLGKKIEDSTPGSIREAVFLTAKSAWSEQPEHFKKHLAVALVANSISMQPLPKEDLKSESPTQVRIGILRGILCELMNLRGSGISIPLNKLCQQIALDLQARAQISGGTVSAPSWPDMDLLPNLKPSDIIDSEYITTSILGCAAGKSLSRSVHVFTCDDREKTFARVDVCARLLKHIAHIPTTSGEPIGLNPGTIHFLKDKNFVQPLEVNTLLN